MEFTQGEMTVDAEQFRTKPNYKHPKGVVNKKGGGHILIHKEGGQSMVRDTDWIVVFPDGSKEVYADGIFHQAFTKAVEPTGGESGGLNTSEAIDRAVDKKVKEVLDGCENTAQESVTGLNASEAVYGFAAWLSTRDGEIKLGASYNCGVIADLVKTFCEVNNLPPISGNWPENMTHPSEEGLRPDPTAGNDVQDNCDEDCKDCEGHAGGCDGLEVEPEDQAVPRGSVSGLNTLEAEVDIFKEGIGSICHEVKAAKGVTQTEGPYQSGISGRTETQTES